MKLANGLLLAGLWCATAGSAGSAYALVVPDKELVITNLAVVEDPVRTVGCGVWTFCNLMTRMARNQEVPQDPALFAEDWVKTWSRDVNVNGFLLAKRPTASILNNWPRLANGKLDLTKAPFRLLAIINRVDLRNAAAGDAGEGRFVFGLTNSAGSPQSMTVIFEYKLPLALADLKAWSNLWHRLGRHATFSEQYKAELQAVTQKFAASVVAGRPGRSALGQLRTNEIALAAPWELREFRIHPTAGLLRPTTVKMTPDASFNNTAALGQYINENEAAILQERHVIKLPVELTGSAPESFTWRGTGVRNPEARFKFALNTCNGCHLSETQTSFTHVKVRAKGQAAGLSNFFLNVPVRDGNGTLRTFNEMNRRRLNFDALLATLNGTISAPTVSSTATATATATMAKMAAPAAPEAPVRMSETGLTPEEQLRLTDSGGRVH